MEPDIVESTEQGCEEGEEDDVFLPYDLKSMSQQPRRRHSTRSHSRSRRKSSFRRMSMAQQRRATFAVIPGAETQGFNNSGLIQNFRNNSTELGLTPTRQNFDNFLSPIGVAPDAPVSRSRSVNHLHVVPILPQDDLKRKSMQHFGSNISLASHVFPQPWQPSAGDRPMYDGPDLPSTDLPEDHLAPEPQPLPLDVTRLCKIEGYEHVGYHLNTSGPPIPPPLEDIYEHEKPEEKFSSISEIDEAEAREALLNFVAEKCCYGKSAAADLQILKIAHSCALHYTLETYIEQRSTTWEQEPYRGQLVDGVTSGEAPGPWDIHCHPTQMFHDECHQLEVPHTANVVPCHGCTGHGWIRCHGCLGRGYLRCLSCSGTGREWHTDARGHRHMECCWHCHGTGRKRCFACGADGRIVCRTCQGYRQLKCYIKLTIEFENHLSEKIVEKAEVPEDMLKNVPGDVVFQQTQPRIWAITTYPDNDLCFESQRLVADQQSRFQNSSRIVMQRHNLQAVPIAECTYFWKDEEDGRFWVFGKEGNIYAPEYPQRYCWGCVIL